MAASVFVGMPDASEPVKEIIRYKTDIISAQDGTEQRIPLLATPFRVISFRAVEIDEAEGAMLQSVLDAAEDARMRVPFWPEWSPLDADVISGATSFVVDVEGRRFEEGGLLMIWGGETENEVLGIDTIDLDGTITPTTTVAGSYPAGTAVMPVLEGIIPSTTQVTRVAGQAPVMENLTVEVR
jgi:uncharacterized protein (UPF0216 family)